MEAMLRVVLVALFAAGAVLAPACGQQPGTPDAGEPPDVGPQDDGGPDAGYAGVRTVRGRIVTADPGHDGRAPVRAAFVSVQYTNLVATTGEDGGFELVGVPDVARVQLLVRRPAHAELPLLQRLLTVELEGAGEGVELENVLVGESPRLYGHAVRSDRQERLGHGGIFVFTPHLPFATATAADGAFELAGLPSGELSLGVWTRDYRVAYVDGLALRPAERFVATDLQLSQQPQPDTKGRVSGRIVVSDGRLIEAQITAFGSIVSRSVAFGTDGRYEAELDPGLYTLEFADDRTPYRARVPNVLVVPGIHRHLPDVHVALEPQAQVPDGGSPPDAGPGAYDYDAPVARILGPATVAPGAPISFDGSTSLAALSAPGRDLSFSWRQTGGPAAVGTFSFNDSPLAAWTEIRAPEQEGPLTFELQVTDLRNQRTGQDRLVVEVRHRPVARVTPREVMALPGASLTFDSAGSSGPEGQPLTFSWQSTGSDLDVPPGAAGPRLTLAAPTSPGFYRLGLKASTPLSESLPAEATIEVVETARAPELAELQDRAVEAGGRVEVEGVMRSAVPVQWRWRQLSGPTVALVDARGPRASFFAPAYYAVLGFEVEVTSTAGSARRTFTVEVLDTTAPRRVGGDPATDLGGGPWLGLSARFDEPLDPGSVHEGTASLSDLAGRTLPSTVAYEAASFTVRVQPATPLVAGTSYRLRLGALADRAPVPNLRQDEVIQFVARSPLWSRWSSATPSRVAPGPGVAASARDVVVYANRDTASCEEGSWVLTPGEVGVLTEDAACRPAPPAPGPLGRRGFSTGAGQLFGLLSVDDGLGTGEWLRRDAAGHRPFGPGHPWAFTDGTSLYGLSADGGVRMRPFLFGVDQWAGGAGELVTGAAGAGTPAYDGAAGAGEGTRLVVAARRADADGGRLFVRERISASQWLLLAGRAGADGAVGIGVSPLAQPRAGFVRGEPFVAWLASGLGPQLQLATWDGLSVPGIWTVRSGVNVRGPASDFDTIGRGNAVFIAYVAGNGLYVRRLDLIDGGGFADLPGPEGDALNADPACQAGHPELAFSDGALWITWSERCAAESWHVRLAKLE